MYPLSHEFLAHVIGQPQNNNAHQLWIERNFNDFLVFLIANIKFGSMFLGEVDPWLHLGSFVLCIIMCENYINYLLII